MLTCEDVRRADTRVYRTRKCTAHAYNTTRYNTTCYNTSAHVLNTRAAAFRKHQRLHKRLYFYLACHFTRCFTRCFTCFGSQGGTSVLRTEDAYITTQR